jgi:hypothetical protein
MNCRLLLCVAMLSATSLSIAADKDDDDDKAPTDPNALPSLSIAQQKAVGIVVAHPTNASLPQRIAAFGLVLDAATLVADAGEVESTSSAARAAAAEAERLHGLLSAGAGASTKALQAAQAEQIHARTQADSANAHFVSRWGPLASMPAMDRQKIIDAAAKGRTLLARAELPGRRAIGALPQKALIDVDQISVPARVLGALAQSTNESQGAGLLLEIPNAPAGLGAGARVPITLIGAAAAGVLVSKEAILYEEGGAFVYEQVAKKAGDDKTYYRPVKVKLLSAQDGAWIVDGIDDDDDVVMRGAGVLWSLQGVAGHPADDDDD